MVEGEPVAGATNPPANICRNHDDENKCATDDKDCDEEMIDTAIRQRIITIFVPTVAPDERLKTISDDGGQVERMIHFLRFLDGWGLL